MKALSLSSQNLYILKTCHQTECLMRWTYLIPRQYLSARATKG